MEFRKAERKQVKLKIGLSGVAGSGKTYSALLIAHGICNDWSKIAVIDTENGSGELYSNLGEYSVCPLAAPFTPAKYVEAIHAAEAAGFNVLIIDSLSHAWIGDGGLLDMQNKATQASKSGNSYTAWRNITPEYQKLVDAILQSPLDIIVTLRSKPDFAMSNDTNGKNSVKKVGLAPQFREGFDYELTVWFDVSLEGHLATVSKDRTELFDNKIFLITEDTGRILAEWRNSGVAYKCQVCGKTISPDLYRKSIDKYGVPLCSAECKAKYDSQKG